MCGLAGGGVAHHLEVAVVGAEQHLAAGLAQRGDDAADGQVERFGGAQRGGEVAGVADHVGVGEVAHDEVVAARADRLAQLVGDFGAAHLGLAGRRSRPWGWAPGCAPRPANGSSRPPLRKKVTWAYFSVSAMRSCVRPCAARYSRQRVGHALRREGHRVDRQVGGVLGQGDVGREAEVAAREARGNPARTKAAVSWRARSARKFM